MGNTSHRHSVASTSLLADPELSSATKYRDFAFMKFYFL